MNTPRRIILALPAYNEAENLPGLLAEAKTVFERENYDYSIIVVDDGSTDATAATVESLTHTMPLRLVQHPQNRGLSGAIRTCVRESLADSKHPDDIIINMDADATHSPEYIASMAAKIDEGNDVVIASRFQDGSHQVGVPIFRRFLSVGARWVFQTFLNLPEVTDYTCGYRAYRSSTLRAAADKYGDKLIEREGFACTDELLVRVSKFTRRIAEVPFVLRYDNKRGKSKMPLLKTIWETVRLLFFTK